MSRKIQAEEIRKVLMVNDVTGGARKTKTLACNVTGLSPHSVCYIFRMLEAHNENGIAGIYSAHGCSDRLRDAFAEALGYDAKQRAEAKLQREKTLDAIQASTAEQKPDDNKEEATVTEKTATATATAATPAVIEELLASIVQSLDVIAEELVHLRYAV
jgi:hypothetical protein